MDINHTTTCPSGNFQIFIHFYYSSRPKDTQSECLSFLIFLKKRSYEKHRTDTKIGKEENNKIKKRVNRLSFLFVTPNESSILFKFTNTTLPNTSSIKSIPLTFVYRRPFTD